MDTTRTGITQGGPVPSILDEINGDRGGASANSALARRPRRSDMWLVRLSGKAITPQAARFRLHRERKSAEA